jgi:hypothetical protein
MVSGDAIRLTVSRRIAFVLVGSFRNFDIAKLKLADQTLEDHEPLRTLDRIMVEMRHGADLAADDGLHLYAEYGKYFDGFADIQIIGGGGGHAGFADFKGGGRNFQYRRFDK